MEKQDYLMQTSHLFKYKQVYQCTLVKNPHP